MTFIDAFARLDDVRPGQAGPARATLCHGASGLTVFGPGPGHDETRYAIRIRLDAEAAVVIEGGNVPASARAPIKLSDERLVLLSRDELASLHKRAGDILGRDTVYRAMRIEPGAMPTSQELLTSLTRPPLAVAIAAGAAPTSQAVLPARHRIRLLARIEAGLPMVALALTIAMAGWGLHVLQGGRHAASAAMPAARAAPVTSGTALAAGPSADQDAGMMTGRNLPVSAGASASAAPPLIQQAVQDRAPALGDEQGATAGRTDGPLARAGAVTQPPDAPPRMPASSGAAQPVAMAASPQPLALTVPAQPAGTSAAPQVAAPLPGPQRAATAPSPLVPSLPVPSPLVLTAAPPPPVTAQSDPAAPVHLASLAPVTTAPPAVPPADPSSPHISIHAKATSWITLRDRQGRLVGERLMPTGEDWTPPQSSGMRLTTGNAGGTELVIDGGRRITLGREGVVRRDVELDTLTN